MSQQSTLSALPLVCMIQVWRKRPQQSSKRPGQCGRLSRLMITSAWPQQGSPQMPVCSLTGPA
eukprot:1146865-Pelagomonas_calceolata.AAC.4